MKSESLVGKKFGRWTVLERYGSKVYRHEYCTSVIPLYLCRCDCGVEAVVLSKNLTSGGSKSCGCLRDDLRRERARK